VTGRRTGVRPWLVALPLAVLVPACSDDAEPLATGGATTSTSAADPAADLAIERCSDLPVEAAAVDGPLSSDPQVATWQQQRADVGMASDEASTVAAEAAGNEIPDVAGFGWPMTDEEFTGLMAFQEQAGAAIDEAQAVLDGRPELGSASLDNARRLALITTAGDAAALQAELDAAIGEGRVVVEHVVRSEADLLALAEAVREYIGPDLVSTGVGNRHRRLTVGLGVLDPAIVADLAAAFPDDVDAMCVEGALPADVVPEGPQPTEGDGWRLLADEPGVGVPYDTGVATSEQELDALWAEIGIPSAPPDIDFEREVVVWFGPAVSGSCDDIRMDDVVLGDEVYPVIVLPGGMRGCTDDANPHAYVVAIERVRIPARFTITLGEQTPDACCPEARTEVEL
jgi:hypothetical protein